MPARYEFHGEAGFVEAILERRVTALELRQMLERLFAEPAWDPKYDGLADLTGGQLELTQADVAALAEQLLSSPASRGRWAFVVTSELNRGLVRMISSLVAGVPSEVRIFESRREAIEWLVASPPRAAREP
jgi:hypothetical protein